MSKVDNKSPGFKTCGHNCHDPYGKKSRVVPAMRNIHIFNTAGSGQMCHEKRHRCTQETRSAHGCPVDVSEDYWLTTDEEYIKFSGCLVVGRKGITYERTVKRYKEAWKKLYPSQEVPLTSTGKPLDFLWDPAYPCPKVPWLKDIPNSPSSSSSPIPSSSGTSITPPSGVPTSSSGSPVPSSSGSPVPSSSEAPIHTQLYVLEEGDQPSLIEPERSDGMVLISADELAALRASKAYLDRLEAVLRNGQAVEAAVFSQNQ
ncbi:hypothetical protein BYT27DRAFT_7214245 [Phlegmacium glaucopus]|nr:hypothetical protein BYT27DRAFT_7214245 [Phlegmacium glaucopus]